MNQSISSFGKCILYYPELKNLKKFCYNIHKEHVEKDKFFEYIEKGEVESVYCCAKKYKINLRTYCVREGGFKEENALMYACFVNQLKIVKLLVETFKMCLEWKNSKEFTALTYACHYHQIDIAEYLIEKGANVNHIDMVYNGCYDYLNYNEKKRIAEFIENKNLSVDKPSLVL